MYLKIPYLLKSHTNFTAHSASLVICSRRAQSHIDDNDKWICTSFVPISEIFIQFFCLIKLFVRHPYPTTSGENRTDRYHKSKKQQSRKTRKVHNSLATILTYWTTNILKFDLLIHICEPNWPNFHRQPCMMMHACMGVGINGCGAWGLEAISQRTSSISMYTSIYLYLYLYLSGGN